MAGGAASALCFAISVFVTFIGSLFGILAPVPIIALTLRKGWQGGGLATLVAALLIGIGLKPVVALYFLIQFGLLGLIAAYLIEKRMPFGFMMLVASLTVVCGFFLLMGIQAMATHQGIFEVLRKPLQQNIQAALSSYPGLSGTEARETGKMLKKMLSFLIVLVPALVVIGSWMILLVDLYVIDRFRLFPERELLKFYDLNSWKAPDHFIWFVIIPGFAVFLLHGTLRMVGLNVLIIALTVYFFQGICIVNFYFTKKSFSPFMKFFFYFLLFLLQIVAIAVVVLGLLDMWMDFRKIFHKAGPLPPAGHQDGTEGGERDS